VTGGFGIGNFAAPELDGAGRAFDWAEPLTGRTWLFRVEESRLAFQQVSDGGASHDPSGVGGGVLDVIGVEVEVRPDLIMDPACHNFPPSLSETFEGSVIDRRRLAEGHRRSILGLAV